MTTDSRALPYSPAAAAKPVRRTSRWRTPSPNRSVMWFMGLVNRWLLLRGWFRVAFVVIPPDDMARLRAAVNPGTAAFLGPNHPEFGADWMIDKEISTMVAPGMASWADRGIVQMAPRFWAMNNLVANDGGEDAQRYSVQTALAGEGVLLHPEGSVRWTNDHVHPLFPGIARMALAAAGSSAKPAYIVPIVWKYQFTGDVSDGIRREIRVIERGLGLPHCADDQVATRFAALQENILRARAKRFGFTMDGAQDFFARQASFQSWLVHSLEQRHTTEVLEDLDRHVTRMSRVIREKIAASDTPELREDLAMAEEAKRLGEFPAAIYGSDVLSQEQISESLKRIRDRLMRRGWRNTFARMLPRPLGQRIARVRVPEGILVEPGMTEEVLLSSARSAMQRGLDEINASIAAEVHAFAHPNPFRRD